MSRIDAAITHVLPLLSAIRLEADKPRHERPSRHCAVSRCDEWTRTEELTSAILVEASADDAHGDRVAVVRNVVLLELDPLHAASVVVVERPGRFDDQALCGTSAHSKLAATHRRSGP